MSNRHLQAPAPNAAPPLARWAGIDPGGTVGLVCLTVPSTGSRAHDIDAARLVGVATATATGAQGYTRAGARGTMLLRVRQQLIDWEVTHVALEEPSTLGEYASGQGQGKRRQAQDTGFYLGMHCGLALGAVVTMPWPVQVWSYPPTTSRRLRGKTVTDEQVGWMEGRSGKIPSRDTTLERMTYLFRALQQRPHDGVLPTLSEQRKAPNDHTLMALGVLNYHLLRERGR